MTAAHRWLALSAAVAAIALPVAACDLKAEFVAPTGPTHNGAKPLPWEIRFSNVAASGDCPGNQVSLVRQAADAAQSGSNAIGGIGPATLPALTPKQSVTLRLVENAPPKSGEYVYRLSYAIKFLDANERNHQPTKAISFHAGYAIGG